MNPVDFLIALWGQRIPRGVIQVWELERRRSHYLRAPAGAAGLNGSTDLYTAVSLAAKPYGPRHRARADQAVAIPGLWLDIDINGGPDNKTGAAPDQSTALRLAHAIAAPTLLIDSGHGIHAWWLLEEPWCFASAEEQQHAAVMSAQWHALHRTRANEIDFTIDSVHDLARVMRLPGTFNAKGGQRVNVTALATDGPRHRYDNLDRLCATAGDVTITTSLGDAETGSALPDIVFRAGNVDAARLEALRANLPDFNRSWMHARGDGWSLSEYDLSIATFAAQAGWTDQEVADLIVLHRRTWNPTDRKAERPDYLRRTVAKARHSGERATAAQRLAALANGRAA